MEGLLLLIIWAGYGAFAAYQTNMGDWQENDNIPPALVYAIYIIAAPLVFICKAAYGAFKRYKVNDD